MAQWPFSMPTPNNKVGPPMTIPEEWKKANKALQAVQQPKSPSTTSSGIKQEPTVNYQYPFTWGAQPMFPFPGYQNYPAVSNYNFYNFDFNSYMMNNNQYYMPSMPMSNQASASQPLNNVKSEANSSEAKVEESGSGNILVSEAVSLLASKPPPPPPPTPPTLLSGEVPGPGGIKFNLPKKKNQKNNFHFQKNRDKLQERINSFRNHSECSPDFDDSTESPLGNNSMQQNAPENKAMAMMGQDSWPLSLKMYVNDCFKKCKTDLDKDQVEIILKGKLTKAFSDGSIWTKDWDLEALPNIHSERLQKEQNTSPLLRNNTKTSPPSASKNSFQHRNKTYSPYYTRSRSRSRSRSCSPPRKIIRKKKHSRSSSSESSTDSRNSRKQMVNSSIGVSEPRNMRNYNTPKNKKKKKKGNKMPFTVEPEFSTNERLQKRAARFDVTSKKGRSNNLVFTISNPFVIDESGADIEWGSDAVMGTCRDLEKPFLRLTGAVDPTTVRPEEVLIKSLTHVKEHWIKNQDYHFVCEQLKSIRQDLVVQCVRNRFTVQVYETHARIALEKGDHTEFNQCQSQLKVLYKETQEGNRLEFTGYHILYNIYTENAIELKNILCLLTAEDKNDEVVSHALKLTNAWSSNNYHRFFKLCKSAPKMSGYVIDWFIERIRKAALKAYVKSYRPNLPVSFIEREFAFPSSEDCVAFLSKTTVVFADVTAVNCKESMGVLTNF